MKYYTPDLLARFGAEDLKVAKAAQQELERRAEAYVAHLDRARPKLPPRFVELQDRFYLHDAKIMHPFTIEGPFFSLQCWPAVLGAGRSGAKEELPALCLVAQLDTPPHEILVLHYRGVREQSVRKETAGYGDPCPYLEWGYDEIDLVDEKDAVRLRHSILFTNGVELNIVFEDFDFATLRPLPDGVSPQQCEGSLARG